MERVQVRLVALCALAWVVSGAAGEWMRRIPESVNGRKVESFWQGGSKTRGERSDVRNLVLVQHPVPGKEGKGRPLYVVLHSAGHDALSALECTYTPGNHDIYRAPDDFYALYVDCRAYSDADWWWGADRKAGMGDTACERRVMDTVAWALQTYGCDSNRVYLCGNSMGGSGALGLGLAHGDVFAAVKANVPAIRRADHPFKSLGLPPYAADAAKKLPDPPVTVDYSGQDDGWSDNHERLVAGMRERKYAWMFFWGAYGHANNNAKMAEKNDIIHAFDWLSVRLDEPYPVFTGASCDTPCPWPADRGNKGAGQINGFFRWEGAKESADGVSIALRLVAPEELKSRFFTSPESARADVTLRRLRAFKVKPGDRVRWSFGDAAGEVVADADGLVTVPGLEVARAPRRLVLGR